VFSSSHTTPGLSFSAVLRSNTQQQQQQHQPPVAQACPTTVGEMGVPLRLRHNQQVPSQSVQAPDANSSPLKDMFPVIATILQQIMTELSGAELEEDRIVAITEIVLKLMEQNGC
jgi:hypothetical protein